MCIGGMSQTGMLKDDAQDSLMTSGMPNPLILHINNKLLEKSV